MARTAMILLIVMSPLLFSCSMNISATSYHNRLIPSIELSIRSSSNTWESSDLNLVIRQDLVHETATFTGELTFNSSILMSFPVIERFSMALLLQDRYGTVLKREPLYLGIIHHQFARESYNFKLQTRLPEHAASYTFEYSGSFSDYGEFRPDSIYIAYRPPQLSGTANQDYQITTRD